MFKQSVKTDDKDLRYYDTKDPYYVVNSMNLVSFVFVQDGEIVLLTDEDYEEELQSIKENLKHKFSRFLSNLKFNLEDILDILNDKEDCLVFSDRYITSPNAIMYIARPTDGGSIFKFEIHCYSRSEEYFLNNYNNYLMRIYTLTSEILKYVNSLLEDCKLNLILKLMYKYRMDVTLDDMVWEFIRIGLISFLSIKYLTWIGWM